ncbi:D-methionine transport system permease protein [Clostridium pascui]|uniref:methionine ABC transporter permease n=1 Tax=Clostridium pascui TaxID=46609 RepID=UPI0019577525|nr:methionine ABC transporter permease [Clostridium pascui]MBM7871618.1 D-methionine transport system permease protein [Clostridium pascui]
MSAFNLTEALTKSFNETALMVLYSLGFATVFGGLLGLLLFLTSNSLFIKNKIVNEIAGVIINITRSIPFLILLVLLIPVSKKIVGTGIGYTAVIVPLSIAAIAFYGRLAEVSFSEVNHGVLEAAVASGARPIDIIIHILIPEALPQLIKNLTVTAVSLIGYSAMAGTVGGGGIGDLAIRYGYQRYQTDVMFICVITLIIIVQLLQIFGDFIAKRTNKKLR